ncbi:MAG TPA: hypothetical protein VKB54_06865 [Solirubrobacteraceae bacterium]|nr:hypothetical protein [Solirubrobacteraceae bacterium]
MTSEADLERLTRDELNARAAGLGIDAAGLPNKAAVVAAIARAEQATGGGPASRTARTAARARLLRIRRRRGRL